MMMTITKKLIVDSCANVCLTRVRRDIELIQERQIHEDYKGNFYRFTLKRISKEYNTWESCIEYIPYEEVN